MPEEASDKSKITDDLYAYNQFLCKLFPFEKGPYGDPSLAYHLKSINPSYSVHDLDEIISDSVTSFFRSNDNKAKFVITANPPKLFDIEVYGDPEGFRMNGRPHEDVVKAHEIYLDGKLDWLSVGPGNDRTKNNRKNYKALDFFLRPDPQNTGFYQGRYGDKVREAASNVDPIIKRILEDATLSLFPGESAYRKIDDPLFGGGMAVFNIPSSALARYEKSGKKPMSGVIDRLSKTLTLISAAHDLYDIIEGRSIDEELLERMRSGITVPKILKNYKRTVDEKTTTRIRSETGALKMLMDYDCSTKACNCKKCKVTAAGVY